MPSPPRGETERQISARERRAERRTGTSKVLREGGSGRDTAVTPRLAGGQQKDREQRVEVELVRPRLPGERAQPSVSGSGRLSLCADGLEAKQQMCHVCR